MRAAAAARVARARAQRFADLESVVPLTDPIDALLGLAGQAIALVDVLRVQVSRLDAAGFDGLVSADLAAYMAALRRAESILTNISRLGLEDRLLALKAHQIDLLHGAVAAMFAELGLDEATQVRARVVLATQLRKAAPQPELERGDDAL